MYYQILLHSRESPYGLREYIYCHKHNVGRIMNVKGEGSEESEEHDIGNWRRCDIVNSGRKLS